MGLPNINIEFKSKGATAVARSESGIVACILKDDTSETGSYIYESITDIDFTEWQQTNHEYLKLIFAGTPHKVIVLRMANDSTDYAPLLKKLKDLKWNYITVPCIIKADVLIISAWIKEQREQKKKTFKAVLPDCLADHEGIINFTTNNIKTVEDKTYSTAEYCARIAGLLAGLSLSQSCTYFKFNDIVSADVPDDPDERIDKGELIIVFDSQNYKIGRGVNSLTTFTIDKGADFSKIKIIEAKDLYQDDIRSTFENSYLGKMRNDYDGKQAIVAAINTFHKELSGDVLDKSFDNKVCIDIDAQREYLMKKHIDVSTMTPVQIAQHNTGSQVFLLSTIKFVDAMEDMKMTVII